MLHMVNHCLLHFNCRPLSWITFIQFICFTLLFDQDCVRSMSPQKLSKLYLVIIYLLEYEQELSLGMQIRLKRIYNFLLFHACYISLPHVFIMFLYHFGIFYGTNLLTRCPVPVHVFCYLFVSEKLVGKVSPNRLKNYGHYCYIETKTPPGGHMQGGL